MKPIWILIEGPDGASKSTTVNTIVKNWKYGEIVSLHDPGISKDHVVGQKIREFVKNWDMSPDTETLLFMAARTELVHHIKALQEQGKSIILDRYRPSTAVYQGIIKGRTRLITELETALQLPDPDITIYLKAPFDVLTQRLISRASNIDKFKSNDDFRKKVWKAYGTHIDDAFSNCDDVFTPRGFMKDKVTAGEKDGEGTIYIVDASGTPEEVYGVCKRLIDIEMKEHNDEPY